MADPAAPPEPARGAYLVVREGESERIFPLGVPETTIGRSRTNLLHLAARAVSRHHCAIVRAGEGYRLVDRKSSNRMGDQDLADGDVITIGEATLIFRSGGSAAAPPPAEALPFQDRNVRILLDTIVTAASARDIESFLTTAVDNVVAIAHAERGILYVQVEGELRPRMARDAERRPLTELGGASRAIPREVHESRKAIYMLDSGSEDVRSESMVLHSLRTVMCAPLRVGKKLLGVLYVDSHAKARSYSATDLAIFEAVANYLALTMENLRTAQERRVELEQENAQLRAALGQRKHLIGECPAMKEVYDQVRRAALADITVLVRGESGTGKEAIAHVLHDLSPRVSKPFVVIDCAAIPETLLESELFGYEEGAFTGASARKPGLFETACGGTLFLDEIGELLPALQVKLLRALEQKTLLRTGGIEPVPIDVRLVAATNRNLEEMVKEGAFRRDLYFRLNVLTITLPPLRQRGADLLLLANHFLAEANANYDRLVKGFSKETLDPLKLHRWDGNVRELKHRVEQAVILTSNEELSAEDLGLSSQTGVYRALDAVRDRFEKSYILQVLLQNNYNVTHSAKELDISRQHLQNLIRKYAIPKPVG
jgi:Nif-specific regulatory protein